MSGNLPLGFGLALAGAVVATKGAQAFEQAFGGGGSKAQAATPASAGPTGKGGKASIQDLENAWIAAGGNRASAPIAAAIAMAESSGSGKCAPDPPGESCSVWQVHMNDHPQYDRNRLQTDLVYAAKAAVEISNNGRNWNPWTTYTHGKYQQFMNEARRVFRSLQAGATIGGP